MPQSDRFLLFIEYFNTGKFMSAQTTLDEDWIEETGDQKTFLGGLIQVSVSLYHVTNGNPQGAPKIWQKAKGMLQPFLPKKDGIDLEKLFKDVDALYAQMSDQLSDIDYMKKAPKISYQS